VTRAHTLSRDGTELAWYDDGAGDGDGGDALVMLHAGVADARMWDSSLGAAGARRVLRYDRRGFGRSVVASPQPYAQTEDLWAVMDAAGVSRAVLVGCSQGGRIAIDAALARPQRVAALVLVAPAVSGAPQPQAASPAIQALFEAYEAADAAGDVDALNEFEARLWLDGPLAAPGRVGSAARRLFLEMNGRALRAGDSGEAIEPPPAWPRLEQLGMPTLLLWGTLDFPHLADRCREMLARIALAQGAAIEGSAHLPSLDAPQALNERLHGFLASV